MKSSAPTSQHDENTALPIARIDAENGIDVTPLREYLEAEGCQVFVGTESYMSERYHIVFGSYGFVKRIVHTSGNVFVPRLILLINGTKEDARTLAHAKTKIILLDQTSQKKATVGLAFSFFFTGKSPVLDMRKNQTEKVYDDNTEEHAIKKHVHPVVQKIPKRSPFSYDEYRFQKHTALFSDTFKSDRERITDLVDTIFWPKKKNSKTVPARIRRFFLGRKHISSFIRYEDPVVLAKKRLRTLRLVVLSFLALLFPILWYIANITISASLVGISAYFLHKGETSRAISFGKYTDYWMYQTKTSFFIISFPFVLLGKEKFVRGQERLVAFIDSLGQAEEVITSLSLLSRTVLLDFFSKTRSPDRASPIATIDQIKTRLTRVGETIDTSQLELASLIETKTFPFVHPGTITLGRRMHAALQKTRDLFQLADKIFTLYPLVSGFKQKQTYLVLLQNSTELRPTGGFIGSIALLTASDGNVYDITVEDVYALDGQLRGHVDPPEPIRTLLGQEHWYLRDSNWDPDFRKSAAQAAWFYEKESGLPVDGVIGISIPLIINVLRVTGPIVLSDFNERITADNFIGKTLFYTQANFFPGSTQKKDFLGSLLTALLETLTRGKHISPQDMMGVVASGFAQRDILFYFQNSVAQQLVDLYGWGGAVPGVTGCVSVHARACLFDPDYIVEANLGVNKVNYYIERSQVNRVRINNSGSIKKTIMRTIRNTSQPQRTPLDLAQDAPSGGGIYRTYIRYIIPRNSKVERIILDGTDVRIHDRKRSIGVLPYAETQDDGTLWLSIGIAFEVPAGQDRQLALEYTRPLGVDGDIRDMYLEIFEQKQPGVSGFPLETIVEYPIGWNAQSASDSLQYSAGDKEEDGTAETILANEGRLEYNTTLSRDVFRRIQFTR